MDQDPIMQLAIDAVRELHRQNSDNYRFPPDVIWSSSEAGKKIPAGRKGSLPRTLVNRGYLKLTGGVARAQAASRRSSKLSEYTFGPELTGRVAVTPANLSALDASMVENAILGFDAASLSVKAEVIARLIAALSAKPFCILTGLAGSGKTKLAEALAMWLSESPAQYRLVAVGADWANNEPLLGYADALHGALYRKPANGALDLMLAASADPFKPYFLILDEMNLSHVERYFADVLSAIESRHAAIALHAHDGKLLSNAAVADVPPQFVLPRNLFIIGTVNVDETTYMFSPKVLDRANVIEFRATRAQISDFLDDPKGLQLKELADQGCGRGASYGAALVAKVSEDVDLIALGDVDANAFRSALLEAFDLLAEMGAEFGFRTAHEISRFVVIHKGLGDASWSLADALDAQVLQKLMPRLHGSARKLEPILTALDGFCAKYALPDSREKIARMQKRLRADGFASFAEN